MATFDLLDAVLPTEGWYCIIGIKDEIAWQRLVETREEADDVARDYLDGDRDVDVADFNCFLQAFTGPRVGK